MNHRTSASRFERILGRDRSDLIDHARCNHDEYASGTPFPHIVFDDFFDASFLDGVATEHEDFSGQTKGRKQYRTANEEKLASYEENHFGPRTLEFLHFLNSSPFLRYLETLTGVGPLIADPHFVGGGLHATSRGGFLKIHADFNIHPEFKLDRRLNLLVYLNRDWDEAWGGHFELWDEAMSQCVHRIAPDFNRVALFSTTSTSFHGQPDPLQCPETRARRSIALYYYTNGRPESERGQAHNTPFKARDGSDHGSTLRRSKATAKTFARNMTPPLLWNFLKRRKPSE